MSDTRQILAETPLFNRIRGEETSALLKCLDAWETHCPKGGLVFCAGDPARHVGVVLDGAVQVLRDNIFGNRAILTQLGRGELFGETFACAEVDVLPISVEAAADSRILLMDYRKIITTCPAACAFHSRLIENMLKILAKKNLMLNGKNDVLSARTTREKLMTYLTAQASQQQSRSVHIPFSRQELADYLSVDRSALSREMSGMRRDGILRYTKNRFELLR